MTTGELNVNREAWKDSMFELVVLGVLIAIVWVVLSLELARQGPREIKRFRQEPASLLALLGS